VYSSKRLNSDGGLKQGPDVMSGERFEMSQTQAAAAPVKQFDNFEHGFQLFTDVSLGLFGRTRGGPAKVAVIASGLPCLCHRHRLRRLSDRDRGLEMCCLARWCVASMSAS
jgi:hypothetical protein